MITTQQRVALWIAAAVAAFSFNYWSCHIAPAWSVGPNERWACGLLWEGCKNCDADATKALGQSLDGVAP
jgi:hypothetical protein